MNKRFIEQGFTLTNRKVGQGFTLIELLIVIAILGTLAVVVLLALNPVQQLARTRDAGRSSAVTQLGHAIEAYATTRGGAYPTTGTCPTSSWITACLVATGEIQTTPSVINYSAGGASCGGENGFCYAVNGAQSSALIYSRAEAKASNSLCATGQNAYFVYSTADGRGGVVCTAGNPSPGQQTFVN